MNCAKCGEPMLPIEKTARVSLAGLVGALVALVGLAALLANPLVGIGLIIVGAVVGAVGRGKRLMLVCPRCGETKPIK